MYESQFGFSASPFSLNPDPQFYFQSKGHGHALSYLRFGVHQGEGFVVVTGDIGAGKTTLVRTLLSELDSERIVAAQIVSTQLDAGDLLRSTAIAFGLATKGLSKAELIATVEAFLTLLATKGKRALLVIDEAQNLDLQAIEELRMLSNFQLGNHALLQSFMVGQPELRAMLTSKPMEQFRQRVIASCHLGPMDRRETQAYVEHRLHKVGWVDRPTFDAAAFDLIFKVSAGIPRRVNLLCGRLLLSAYLADASFIDAALVDDVANEARSEVGESAVEPTPSHAETLRASPSGPATVVARRALADPAGPMLCVAANRTDDAKMAMLLRVLQARKELPPLLLVRIGESSEFALNDAFLEQIGVDVPTIELDVARGPSPEQIAEVMGEFARVVDLHRPAAVVVIGNSDAALACGLVASKTGCRLAHLEAGRRGTVRDAPEEINRVLLDRLADTHCASEQAAYDCLLAEGASESRILLAGNLLSDAVALALSASDAPAAWLARADFARAGQNDKQGYCVVLVEPTVYGSERRYLGELLAMLRKLSVDVPIVWPMSAALGVQLESLGLRKSLRDSRISVVQPLNYVERVSLLGGARCVMTDSADVCEEAAALGVPSLLIEMRSGQRPDAIAESLRGMPSRGCGGEALQVLRAQSRIQAGAKPFESRAAELIAEHLVRWASVDEWSEAAA